ncbi:glycerol-3-phosphate acyltransferase 4 isoform X3 [Amyelois transitella]|uniref:glycerol-3-phosphate acyltransferase 4 isoform X3 n=1 Tax=Amyelois transitella TaxID=680683 RepID=UPI00299007C9|nr:glycerol-3-phosphate acyltransferase 4 isoform X3 [Amyelois transitella]
MALLMPIVSVAISILYTPFLLLILCVIFLASIGKSLGVRRLYVNILLKLFEYGRQHIEVARKVNRSDSSDDEEEPPVPDDKPPSAIIKENGSNGTKMTVIEREEILGPSPELNYKRSSSQERMQNGHKELKNEVNLEFHLSHSLDLVKAGMESIIEDQVTSVFEAEELRSWNLLTRTNRQYEFLTWRLTIIWAMGFIVRYMFLLPLRILIFVIGVYTTIITTTLVSCLPRGRIRLFFGEISYKMSNRIMIRSLSCVATFHNLEYMPKKNGFCVANHTSPIDVAVLSINNCYSLIGQRHGGFLGLLQRALARASPHIWFERSEVKDRHAVAKRLAEHIADPNNPPILIFPEGTCINNTSVMQFKKGSFEVGGTIYPVAIKYLPPMHRSANESAVDFANRVKANIARRGGLVDLQWDGQLKRMKAKKEWRELQQEEFSRRLKGE